MFDPRMLGRPPGLNAVGPVGIGPGGVPGPMGPPQAPPQAPQLGMGGPSSPAGAGAPQGQIPPQLLAMILQGLSGRGAGPAPSQPELRASGNAMLNRMGPRR